MLGRILNSMHCSENWDVPFAFSLVSCFLQCTTVFVSSDPMCECVSVQYILRRLVREDPYAAGICHVLLEREMVFQIGSEQQANHLDGFPDWKQAGIFSQMMRLVIQLHQKPNKKQNKTA